MTPFGNIAAIKLHINLVIFIELLKLLELYGSFWVVSNM